MMYPPKIILGWAVGVSCLVWGNAAVQAQVAVPTTSTRTTSSPVTKPASLLPAKWQKLSLEDFVSVCEPLASVGNDHIAERMQLAVYTRTAYLNTPQALTAATPDQLITLLTVATPGLPGRFCNMSPEGLWL